MWRREARRRRAADLRALGLEEGVHGVVRGRRAVAPHGVLLAVAGQVRPVRVAAGGVHPTETCPPERARGVHDTTREADGARALLRGLSLAVVYLARAFLLAVK